MPFFWLMVSRGYTGGGCFYLNYSLRRHLYLLPLGFRSISAYVSRLGGNIQGIMRGGITKGYPCLCEKQAALNFQSRLSDESVYCFQQGYRLPERLAVLC